MSAARTRIDKWDNLKCILIFLVVTGHFANQFQETSWNMRTIALFIYTFHMPLFIFLSGLLEKKYSGKRPFDLHRVLFYLMLGYTLKIMIFTVRYLFGEKPHFYWLSDTGIPWYMFAMAAFCLLTYLLRNLNSPAVLAISIFAAAAAGYCREINSFLNLSRILVFFPFYYLGYCLDSDQVLSFSKSRSLKLLSAFILAANLAVCIRWIRPFYTYIRLFTGRNPYSGINHGNCGFPQRFLFYIIAFLTGAAVLILTPEKHSRLMSLIGQRTLQIYFWHRLVLYAVIDSGLAAAIRSFCGHAWGAVYLSVGILLTLFLSLKSFGIPFKLLKKFIYRLPLPPALHIGRKETHQ